MSQVVFLNRNRIHLPSELGAIRLGEYVESPKSKSGFRASSSETWLLTSNDLQALLEISQVPELGGENPKIETLTTDPKKALDPDADLHYSNSAHAYRLRTSVSTLPVMLPPGDETFWQSYQLYHGASLVRRCDGEACSTRKKLDGGELSEWSEEGPCICRSGGKECGLRTKLTVILEDGPLGSWVYRTGNEPAGFSLVGSVQILRSLGEVGMPKANLSIGWVKTSKGKHPAPSLIPRTSVRQFTELAAAREEEAAQLAAGASWSAQGQLPPGQFPSGDDDEIF